MKSKSQIIVACIIAAGMGLLGLAIRDGVVSFKKYDRSVTVKGLSEREVKANKVTWSLMYKELGNNPAEMYETMNRKNRAVIDFLKNGGIEESEISLNAPTIVDRQADNYGNEIMNFRYRAKGVITVTSTNVDQVRALMLKQAELMKQGIALVNEQYEQNSRISYEFTDLNTIKPEMVEEATKNARTTAEKFAEDSGSKLGVIRRAQQGQFSINNRDDSTPYVKRIRVVTTVEYTLE